LNFFNISKYVKYYIQIMGAYAHGSQNSPPERNPQESDIIGQRLRSPSGRKPAPSRKADFAYPGKDYTGKVQSQSKV
jgi:hypothetical protein